RNAFADSRHDRRNRGGRGDVSHGADQNQNAAAGIAAVHCAGRTRVQGPDRLCNHDIQNAGDPWAVPRAGADADGQRSQGRGAVPDVRHSQGATAGRGRQADDAADDGGGAVRGRDRGRHGGGAVGDDKDAADPRPMHAPAAVPRDGGLRANGRAQRGPRRHLPRRGGGDGAAGRQLVRTVCGVRHAQAAGGQPQRGRCTEHSVCVFVWARDGGRRHHGVRDHAVRRGQDAHAELVGEAGVSQLAALRVARGVGRGRGCAVEGGDAAAVAADVLGRHRVCRIRGGNEGAAM
ncbi:hypothetical protein IWW55_003485, partial [Coemansia sp. RSA 2706]